MPGYKMLPIFRIVVIYISCLPGAAISRTIVKTAAGRLKASDQKRITAGETSLLRKSGRILSGKHIAENLIMHKAK